MVKATLAEELEQQMISDRVEREKHPPYAGQRFSTDSARKTRYIDNNPIVGTLTKYKYGGYFFPLGSFRWVKKETEFALSRGKTSVTEEEKA